MGEASSPQRDRYGELTLQLRSLLDDESDPLANLANCAALLYHALDRVNWVGFYLLRENELVLGPFQGKVACTRIALGKGVCGTSAKRRESLLVDDVHAFEGHIACDPDSRSELAIPLVKDGRLLAVLDLDSPEPGRFHTGDRMGLEAVADALVSSLDLEDLN